MKPALFLLSFLVFISGCSKRSTVAPPIAEEIQFGLVRGWDPWIIIFLSRHPNGKITCQVSSSANQPAPKDAQRQWTVLKEFNLPNEDFERLSSALLDPELSAAAAHVENGMETDGSVWTFRSKSGRRTIDYKFYNPEIDPTDKGSILAMRLGRDFAHVAGMDTLFSPSKKP